MNLSNKTREKLRNLINEETEYRSGPKLVTFFNELGFQDSYGQGFGSRGAYTDDRLKIINEKPEIVKCIKKLFSPINFVGNFNLLDKLISDFNDYLSFDGWIVVRNGKEITFKEVDNSFFEKNEEQKKENVSVETPEEFLHRKYDEVSLEGLAIDTFVYTILESRVQELHRCLPVNAPLAVIFHSGSILEGILLGVAQKHPREFNTAQGAPTKDDKVKPFHEWTLANFIDVSYSLGFLKEDVQKFSHGLRDFRNYIHPYQQASSRFNPDEDTAKICFQVLKAAIAQIKQRLSIFN